MLQQSWGTYEVTAERSNQALASGDMLRFQSQVHPGPLCDCGQVPWIIMRASQVGREGFMG